MIRRIVADPDRERLFTPATIITFVRTVAAVAIAAWATYDENRTLLIVSLVVYWVGDSVDGWVARVLDHETRTGAVLDILSDRFCAAAFYVGLAWLDPHVTPAVFVYLAEFMVIDCFISLAFLFWPITSPNYFYVIDRKLWLWNWSKPGKATNSALFAVFLLFTQSTSWGVWVGAGIATALLVMKCVSLARIMQIRLPMPTAAIPNPVE